MRTLTFNHIIGSGAMGTVYQAELRVPGGFRRICAVKVMKASTPEHEHFMARMRDEARLLGMLQDEQILGVSELVRVDDRDAVIMEYVEGVDLADLIATRPLPPRALAELGAELAGTLHRAHIARHPANGSPLNVIHRDVKPANVMVTSLGGVRLLDFGVARAAFDARESHTQGLVLGTLNYFPPEVLAGGDPTPAVDIYGLGLTLWECATGMEWGAPRVQRKRFDQRVEQRLAAIQREHAALTPVLRQIVQWDPALRPDGGVVERALLHAADASPGEGLRTWARKVVPEVLAAKQASNHPDALVGRTIQVLSAADENTTTGTAWRNYDDLGPPAASKSHSGKLTPAPVQTVRRKRRPSVLPWVLAFTVVVFFALFVAVLLGVLVGVGVYYY
ncbi:MAG: serine/threonine protein kinase [Deltaproteobacteria bacterium]|nr:serine/threonine protein kinase [Deltaproteobacteria bacterium]